MVFRSSLPMNLNPVHDEWEWQYQGACKSMDTEMFFLDDRMRGSEKTKRERKAVEICNRCPVIQQCLNHALKVPEIYGVWGGTTADQRISILRRKKVN